MGGGLARPVNRVLQARAWFNVGQVWVGSGRTGPSPTPILRDSRHADIGHTPLAIYIEISS